MIISDKIFSNKKIFLPFTIILISSISHAFLPIGEREIFRGDAGLAAHDSLGIIVDAPANLSFIPNKVSASSSSVYNIKTKYTDNTGLRETQSNLETKPNFIGFKFNTGEHHLAGYLFSRLSYQLPVILDSTSQGGSRVDGKVDFDSIAAGVSYSYALNTNHSLGISITGEELQSKTDSYGTLNELPNEASLSILTFNTTQRLIHPLISWAGKWNENNFSLNFQLPAIYSNEKETVKKSILKYQQGEDPVFLSETSLKKKRSDNHQQLSAGWTRKLENTNLHFDLEYKWGQDEYNNYNNFISFASGVDLTLSKY